MDHASVSYSTCCQQGAVGLPSDHLENKLTPPFLQKLFTVAKNFRANIRSYNNAVSFTSTAASQDKSVAGEGGSWSYRIHGQLTHKIGSLLPLPGATKKFAQMFIWGDQADEEVAYRTPLNSRMDPGVLRQIQDFMYSTNPYAKMYKAAEEILNSNPVRTIKIKSLQVHGRDKNRYNYPTCSQVAAVIQGDGSVGSKDRDVIIQYQSGDLRRVSELNTTYFPLRYPVFFMYGSHGWDEHYRHFTARRKQPKLTPIQFAIILTLRDHRQEWQDYST
ncbi:uncharacterized protein MELLADRAFT_33675 [Melampsora larici-populina 98AG31]|uniref:Helitron helicase-like domain-containing protein n=1 Tax=Melampsora larici-populina (strain 98AG31 / pathotype 3-4-7) TaxID=747676 RepID=F4R9Z8_MELLP|nr:uncharacterized protein MELLADRAFT_33675 [Melampsora larici-populina 98AG31]EGG10622.1 hypothetical protein MELLADRAFT_33675 [Melampsora larici-populina 98AG31]